MQHVLTKLFFLCILLVASKAAAQPSLVHYLDLPAADGEWNTIALGPDGSRLYVGNYANTIAVFDTADDSLVGTFELPSAEDEWIGGIGFNPEGRLFVSTDIAFYELDPDDGSVLQQTEVPWSSWWEGPFVFNPAGDRAYLASVYEVFVLEVDPLVFVDTIAGDDIEGLLAVNPAWGTDGLDAYRIALSPDGDRLYLGGEADIKAISGLLATTDWSGLTLQTSPEITEGYPRLALSPDGTVLFDSFGHVWNPLDLTLSASFDFSQNGFLPADVVLAPDGSGMFFEGWSGSDMGLTHDGEILLVADRASTTLVDLDGAPSNGVTGIDLPEAQGWDGQGSYNGLAMVVHPDGEKLYLAAGGSGAMVVSLTAEPIHLLTEFFPRRGGNEGDVTISIATPYPDGTVVTLQRAGQDPIEAYQAVIYPTRFEAIFDLRGVAEGDYNVAVTEPGGNAKVLDGFFTVEPVREDASLEMIGSLVLTYDTEASGRIVVQNTGNVDLRDLIVTLEVSPGTRYRINLPATVAGGQEQRDEEFTVADGIEPIWIDRLKASRPYEFEIVLAGPEGVQPSLWDIDVKATVGYLTADEGTGEVQTTSLGTGTSQSPLIGELCTLGDALVTAMSNELKRRNANVAKGDVADAAGRVVKDTAVEYGVSKVKELAAKALTRLVVAAVVSPALPIASAVFGIVNDTKSCYDFLSKLFNFLSLFSIDPNDKVSTTGLDGFIEGNERIRYIIYFENLPDATAPASLVTITDVLDPSLDLTTFEMVATSHPEQVEVTVESVTRTMTAVFTDIDLPPNVSPPEGQGWLEFTIRPTEGLPDGTVIVNQADIVFDINDPIVTPEVTLEVDLRAPQSAMTALAPQTVGSTIPLSWSGDDLGGVGVWDYTVQVSENGGSFVPWMQHTTATEGTFTGAVGNDYQFLVVARDRFGNEEVKTLQDTATTTIRDAESGGASGGDDGCGCRAGGQRRSSGPWAVALGLLLLAVRRRASARLGAPALGSSQGS